MKKVLIIGATSEIAIACGRIWAEKKSEIYLVARSENKLQQVADDFTTRGASAIHSHILDMNEIKKHTEMLENCFTTLKTIDIVLIAHGTLPDQHACEQDVDLALQEFSTNGLSVIALLTLLANKMEQQGDGTIAVISSVAGDRGRPSNYLYGSAKATVSTFCEGMRARLYKRGVHLLTIKPGFVDTPMTKELELPQALVVSPEKVAKSIHNAIEHGKNTIYTPWFWRYIMIIIKSIPNLIFKKLKL